MEELNIHLVEYDMPNGMHVILAPTRLSPLIAIHLLYHVGSKDEHPQSTGFAHLFEHLMFQGSKHIGKAEHFNHVHNVGGFLNANTNPDRTNYFEVLPMSELELALWLESDRMLALDVSEEKFQNQLAVVKEERRQRYDNQPYGLVFHRMFERLFPNTSYAWPTIGYMEHLDRMELQAVVEFHKKYYHPSNCTLALAGNFEVEEARRLIDKYFGTIPSGQKVARLQVRVEEPAAQMRDVMYDAVKLPALYIGLPSPNLFTPEERALNIASHILGTGKSSRLYKKLVYELQLVEDFGITQHSMEKAGVFFLAFKTTPNASLDTIEQIVWEELERLRHEPVTSEELAKCKNKIEMQFVQSFTELRFRADRLQQSYAYTGNSRTVLSEMKEMRLVTADDILRSAKRYLRPERASVIQIFPKE